MYEADYDEGKCTLSIYQDGSYGVCGYAKTGDAPALYDAEYTISGSTYRSYYYYLGTLGFYYNYTLYTALGTNLSQIHNLTNTYLDGEIIAQKYMYKSIVDIKQ